MRLLETAPGLWINLETVVRVTYDTFPEDPPELTLSFADGSHRTFGYEEASALLEIVTRNATKLNELVAIRSRQWAAQQALDAEGVLF